MAVLEGAFEKCGNLRICGIYGRSSWECFKKASRLRVQRVDMLAMLANPWPIVKLAGFAWKPHRSTALTRRRWWLWWIEAQKILSLRVTIGDWLRLQESGTNGVRRGNRLLATVQSLAQRANWRMTLFDVALCCMIFKSFLVTKARSLDLSWSSHLSIFQLTGGGSFWVISVACQLGIDQNWPRGGSRQGGPPPPLYWFWSIFWPPLPPLHWRPLELIKWIEGGGGAPLPPSIPKNLQP